MAFAGVDDLTDGCTSDTRRALFLFFLLHKLEMVCTHSGRVPFMKKTFRTKILAIRTKAMITKVTCKLTPRIGTPLDVSGRNEKQEDCHG